MKKAANILIALLTLIIGKMGPEHVFSDCNCGASTHLFGLSLFWQNKEYMLTDISFSEEFQHHIITITDSTNIQLRTNPNGIITLKDL